MIAVQQTKKAAKNLRCQGKVFFYDEKSRCGLIQGFDGNGYNFSIAQWYSKNEKPHINMVVNFEISEHERGKEAVSIKIR